MPANGISAARGSEADEITSHLAMISREEILARLNDPSLLLVNVNAERDI